MRRIKKIAEKLVELPKDDSGTLRAGPPFELPYSLRLPSHDADRWADHADVFAMAHTFIEQNMLVADETGDDFLRFLAAADTTGRRYRGCLGPRHEPPGGNTRYGFSQSGAHHGRGGARLHDRGAARPLLARREPERRCSPVDVIVPGDPDGSSLIQRLSLDQSDPGRDAPRAAAHRRERIAFLSDWIARGAPDNVPAGEVGIAAEPTLPREPAAGPPTTAGRPLIRARYAGRCFATRTATGCCSCSICSFTTMSRQNAVDILDVVSAGRMPCDIPWDSNKVATFKNWMDDGLIA